MDFGVIYASRYVPWNLLWGDAVTSVKIDT